ncbi:MAG: hypothetical protein ABIN67_13795 [Ferruginibacter sp.]
MIRINQTNTPQLFALTCTELGVLANPFYLFVFTNDMTLKEQSIVLTDNSIYKSRYNLFEITGTFFETDGWHSYKVYEQDAFNNTDIAMTNGIVEEGRAFVVSSFDVQFKQNDSDTVTFNQYNGN